MRHRKKNKVLDRKRSARDALILSQAKSLFTHEKIVTTITKAKVLRSFVEKLITKGKKKNLATTRYLIKKLNSPKLAKKITDVISPRYKNRNGGYTRIIKLNRRLGDNALKAKIEFVEYEQETK